MANPRADAGSERAQVSLDPFQGEGCRNVPGSVVLATLGQSASTGASALAVGGDEGLGDTLESLGTVTAVWLEGEIPAAVTAWVDAAAGAVLDRREQRQCAS